MTKTFLEWTIADKKALELKQHLETLKIIRNLKIEWISRDFLDHTGL